MRSINNTKFLVRSVLYCCFVRTVKNMNTKEKEKYIEEFDFPHCDESSKYEKVAKIGQGTFG